MEPAPKTSAPSKYQIVEPLRTGGTAAIYLAVMRGENRFSREVVIKRPLPHLVGDRRMRAMFVDEAMIASRLSHPNIVQVIDLVDRVDEVFLVLEFLKGADLREVLKRCRELGRQVPVELSAWIGAEICAGLDFAHDATAADGTPLNLVHRDVSPKNVRVTDRGAVKVIDFGIARAENRTTETAPGSVKGTLGYMSPEQVMGEDIDRRSDIFAFGIMLFQMFTGRNPFDAPTLKERVQRLIHNPIPRPSEFNPEIDKVLDGIVERCLERDLDRRFPRARDAQAELENWLASKQIASSRQHLVVLLEELFPQIHEPPPKLREVLSTLTGLSGPLDELAAWGDGAPRSISAQEGYSQLPTIQSPSNSPPEAAFSAWAGAPSEALARGVEPRSASAASAVPGTPDTSPPGSSSGLAGRSDAGRSASQATSGSDPRPRGESATVVDPRTIDRSTGLKSFALGAFLVLATGAVVLFAARAALEPESLPISASDPVVDVVPLPPAADPQKTEAPPPQKAPARRDPLAGETPKVRDLVPEPKRPDPPVAGRARRYLKAGAMLAKQGQPEDARLLYTLAVVESGSRADPALYRNLALVHRDLGATDKVRACFLAYLERQPRAEDADRIRRLLEDSPAAPPTECVEARERTRATIQAKRIGARIDGWLEEAGE